MWVKYFIPEDGDEPEHPNVFNIKSQGPVTLSIIEKNFPLPGKYVFRQLKKAGNLEVWMDLVDGQPLNENENSIFLKASRVSSASPVSPATAQSTTTTPKQAEQSKPPSVKQPSLLNLNDDVPPPAQTSTTSTPFFDDDLLGFTSAPLPSATPKAHDPFGLDSLQPTPLASSTSTFPSNSPIQPTNTNNNAFRGMSQMNQQQKSFDPFSDLSGGLGSNNNYGARRY